MEIFTPAHSFETWFGRLSVHQDFFWFVSLLAWSLALIAWWRHPARRTGWVWLAPAAIAAITTALIQFGIFNPSLDLFQERLIPGTVSEYRPAAVNPYFLGDILQAFSLVSLVSGWTWLVFSRVNRGAWKLVLAGLPLGIGVLHIFEPQISGWLIVLVTPLLALALSSQAPGERASRIGLAMSALLPVFSTVGPLAMALGMLQRHGPPTPMGLSAAIFQAAVGLLVALSLARDLFASVEKSHRRALWLDARGFFVAALILLIAGLVFAVITARDNRREILENRLRTTAAHARVFEPELLAPLDRPEFWRANLPPSDSASRAGTPKNDGADPARARLRDEIMATPFIQEARIVVVHDGWLIAALSSETGQPAEYLRRATPADIARWQNPAPYYEESLVSEIGYDYFTRAPIVADNGRMLGWLEAVRDEFYLTMERRWRTGPLLFTALGVVLLAILFAQRRSSREREAALRHAAVAAESSRVKTAFFANVSHELRTPLQNILGYSQLLQRDLPLDADQRARFAALHEQGELMKRLVNDLIDLSATEAGAFQLSPRAVSPAELIEHTVESLRLYATNKGLELRCQLSESTRAWMLLDGERFRQVALNLTNNAVKFTDHGHVVVSLDVSPADASRKTRLLELSVSDTGPGIPPAQQARLFTPFSRLAQTANKEGSGLGLSLSAALCRTMGGSLRVESDGTSGSRFIATFAAQSSEAPVVKTVAPDTKNQSPPLVLIVDDNTLVRELFTQSLTQRGARCVQARSGQDALTKAAAATFNTVLLDIALPDGSGTDFVAPLKSFLPGARIIGVSAHAGLAERERALAAGMDAFLVKPVELEQLWRAVVTSVQAEAGAIKPAVPTPSVAPALLDLFAQELPVIAHEISAALTQLNWSTIRARAHYLRNSALVIQSKELFAACTELERAADSRDQVAVERAWERCREATAIFEVPQ